MGGSFTLQNGRSFTASAAFTNAGTIALGSGSVFTAGSTYAQTAGTVTGAGTLTASGLLTWTAGTMGGAGTTVANGGLDLDGPATKTLDGRTFDNAGTATWTGTGDLVANAGSVFNNLTGATFNAQNDSSFVWDGNGSLAPTFNNSGLFHQFGEAQRIVFQNVTFNNNGTVQIDIGELVLAGGTSAGVFTVATGATLTFAGLGGQPSHDLLASSAVTGDGTVQIPPGGIVYVEGAYDVRGLTLVNGAAAFLNDAQMGNATFGGLLYVGAGLRVDGLLTWIGGNWTRPLLTSGTLTVNGTLAIIGAASRNVEYIRVENAGTVNWTGTGNINLINGAVISNLEGATFNFEGDQTVSGSAMNAFLNAGTLRKTISEGVSTISTLFTNTGTVDVQSGTLSLTGTFSNFAGNTLTGGTYAIAGTLQFPNANIQANAANVVLDGPGAQIVDQQLNNALANFAANTAPGSLALQDGANLSIAGPFTNTGAVTVGAGSTFSVGDVYTQTAGSTTLGEGTLTAVLVDVESGVLSGSGTINANVVNAGDLTVGDSGEAGVLSVNGDYTQTGTGILDLKLGGLDPGSGYDQLNVAGVATLAGTLNVTLFNDFVPQEGDTFQVITWGWSNGAFDVLNLPDLGSGLYLDSQYSDVGLVLVTVSR